MLDEVHELKARLAILDKKPLGEASATAATPQLPAVTPELSAAAPQLFANAPQVPPRSSNSANTQAPPDPQNAAKPAPFSFADFSWLTGNPRTTESPLDAKVFTGELRVDTDYVYDFSHPSDHSIGGSSDIFRAGEAQLTQFGIGRDFHRNNVRGRLMTQFGMYSFTTPRNDASPALGRWSLHTAAISRKPTADITSTKGTHQH